MSHFGFLAEHISLPKSTILWQKSEPSSLGIIFESKLDFSGLFVHKSDSVCDSYHMSVNNDWLLAVNIADNEVCRFLPTPLRWWGRQYCSARLRQIGHARLLPYQLWKLPCFCKIRRNGWVLQCPWHRRCSSRQVFCIFKQCGVTRFTLASVHCADNLTATKSSNGFEELSEQIASGYSFENLNCV